MGRFTSSRLWKALVLGASIYAAAAWTSTVAFELENETSRCWLSKVALVLSQMRREG